MRRTPLARHQSYSARSSGSSIIVPVGFAGDAIMRPLSGPWRCAASSISTVGWKRTSGPHGSSTTSTSCARRMFEYAG